MYGRSAQDCRLADASGMFCYAVCGQPMVEVFSSVITMISTSERPSGSSTVSNGGRHPKNAIAAMLIFSEQPSGFFSGGGGFFLPD